MKKNSAYTIVQGSIFRKLVNEDDIAFAFSDGLNKYVLDSIVETSDARYIEADSSVTSGFIPRTLFISADF